MGRRHDERAAKGIELYNSGLSLAQVAGKIGITRSAVFGLLKSRGYSPRKKQQQHSQYFNGKKYTLRANGYYLSTTGNPRTLMHRDVWKFNHGLIPENYDIHHLDKNKAHNQIENLELLSKQEHARCYSTGRNQYSGKKER